MIAVTTFADEHWESHAKTMVETFQRHWPIPLMVMTEQALHAVDGYTAFQERHKDHKPTSYMDDVVRFSHKVFAQIEAMSQDVSVIWLDADIVTLKDVPIQFLRSIRADCDIAILGREGGYTETGFVAFNGWGDGLLPFLGIYSDMYCGDRIMKMDGKTDCHALDAAIEKSGAKVKNLTPNANAFDHCICDSPLAPYLDHLKGPRKALGMSPEHPRANR